MTQYKLYKNIPYLLKIRKDRYFYYTSPRCFDSDTTETINLLEYEGLNYQSLVGGFPCVILRSGVLPNYNFFDGVSGYLFPKGQERVCEGMVYDNFTIMGTPTLDKLEGKVSQFNSSNYLKVTVNLSGNTTIYTKFTVDSDASNQIILSNQTTGASLIRSDNLILKAWCPSATGGTFELNNGRSYWVKAFSDGTLFYLYALEDTGQTLEEAKASQEWVLSWTCSSSLMIHEGENEFIWGRNTNTYSSQCLTGSIELSGTEICAHGEIVWKPCRKGYLQYTGILASNLQDVASERTYNAFYKDGEIVLDTVTKKAQYMWVGEVVVPAHTLGKAYVRNYDIVGQVAERLPYVEGFDDTKYLVSKQSLPMCNFFPINLKIVTRINSGNSIGSVNGIVWDNNPYVNRGFGIYDSKWTIWHTATTSEGAVEANTDYWVQMIHEVNVGTKLYYLKDNGNYTLETLPSLSEWSLGPVASSYLFDTTGGPLRFGAGVTYSRYFYGSIDVLNTVVYTGMGETPENNTMTWTENWRLFTRTR